MIIADNVSHTPIALISGTFITVFLFILLSALGNKPLDISPAVIVIDFMQWREPVRNPVKQPKPTKSPLKKRLDPPKQIIKPLPMVPAIQNPAPRPQLSEEPAQENKQTETDFKEVEQPPPVIEPAPIVPKSIADTTQSLPIPIPMYKVTTVPRFAHKVEPEYPPAMQAGGITAVVKLQVLVDKEGVVRDVQVLESAGEVFDASAIEAACRSTFIPANINGKPVAVWYRFKVEFVLH